ncbi:hypothetical protein [Clostridium tunisiense]|uniref:hypothetical protein n=1 Tax=Clostridium tunisiense TaxID=219748 RepID=UPI0002D4BC47|nr:hypothetical protein [Clostridium tunisiense]
MKGVVYLVKEVIKSFLDNLLIIAIGLVKSSRVNQLKNISFEFTNGEETKFILIYKRK